MKLACEREIEQARAEGVIYSGSNTQDDEDRIALLLRTGTLALKIKSLESALKKSKDEITGAKAREDEQQKEMFNFMEQNEKL